MSRSTVVLILATGLLTRLLVIAVFGIDSDSFRLWEYDSIAAHIAAGEGHRFVYRDTVYFAYAPPVWSYLLAALRVLCGPSPAAIQTTQTACSLLAALVFAGVAYRLFGARAALVAGVGIAIEPGLAFYSVAHSDPLAWNVLVVAWIVRSAVALLSGGGFRAAMSFGLAVGVGVLSRGTPVVALAVVAALSARRSGLRRAALLATALATLVVMPWLVRNRALTGAWLLTSTTGENFWKGNHAGSSGGAHDQDGGLARDRMPESIERVLRSPGEAAHQRAFLAAGLTFWRDRPLDALDLAGRKVTAFVFWGEFEGLRYPAWARIASRIVHLCVLVLALGSALRNPYLADARVLFAIGLYGGIALLQATFYVEGRHRLVVEPLLLLVASALGTEFPRAGTSALPGKGPRGATASRPSIVTERNDT